MKQTTNEMYKTIKPPRKGKTYIIILSVLAVLGVAIFLYFQFFRTAKPVDYVTEKPFTGEIISTVSANGTINATNEVKIGSQISGTITEVKVEENDIVKNGQVMAIINPETIYQTIDRYKAQLGSANAMLKTSEIALANKKWNYEQLQKLYKATDGKSPSLYELQNAQMDYQTAVADINVKKASIIEVDTNLKSAMIDLKNSIIVSPIDGVVLKKSIEAGQTVAASFSTPELFTVAENLEKMKLVVNVSEAEVGMVEKGQRVEFTVDTYPDHIFTSTVYRVNMGAKDSTDNIVSYETTIYIDNIDMLLKSGMSATADIETAKSENAMIIPISALFFNPSDASLLATKSQGGLFGNMSSNQKVMEELKVSSKRGFVWILKNGQPERIEVETGVSNGKQTQIMSDVINIDTEVIVGVKTKK